MYYISVEKVKELIESFKEIPDFYKLDDLKRYIVAKQNEYYKGITAPPTDEERNLVYCLSLRDNITAEEVDILSEEYGWKVQVYNAISSIAQRRGIDILGYHPFIGEYEKCEKAYKYIKEYLEQDTQKQLAGIDEFQKRVIAILS